MSDIERQVGEALVDDMLPAEPKPVKIPAYRGGRSRREMEGRLSFDQDKYGTDFWEKGGDSLDDLTGRGQPDMFPAPKVKTGPIFKRGDVRPSVEGDGVGGWARAKLKHTQEEFPLVFIGNEGTIDTLLLETVCSVMADEFADMLDETDLVWSSEGGKKLRLYLRQFVLDECQGWDKMVKKYKKITEAP